MLKHLLVALPLGLLQALPDPFPYAHAASIQVSPVDLMGMGAGSQTRVVVLLFDEITNDTTLCYQVPPGRNVTLSAHDASGDSYDTVEVAAGSASFAYIDVTNSDQFSTLDEPVDPSSGPSTASTYHTPRPPF